MPIYEYKGLMIELDEEGYLVNIDDWNEEVACALAFRAGVSEDCPIPEEKMEIIRFMRAYYKKFRAFPIPRYICKNLHRPKECTYEEFPDPEVAWKIAGLPNLHPEVYATIKRLKAA